MIRAPDDYANPGKLWRLGGRHLSRKPSQGAAGQPPADMRVVSDRGVYPGGDDGGVPRGARPGQRAEDRLGDESPEVL